MCVCVRWSKQPDLSNKVNLQNAQGYNAIMFCSGIGPFSKKEKKKYNLGSPMQGHIEGQELARQKIPLTRINIVEPFN